MDSVLYYIDPTNELAGFGSNVNSTHILGYRCEQIYHRFPYTDMFYFDIEKLYDPVPVHRLMRANNYVIPVSFVVLYVLFCYFGQKFMAKRQAFELTSALAMWNLFLSVFSLWGAIRTVPHMIMMLSTMSIEDALCKHAFSAYGGGATGMAVQLFCWSKIPELIDSVFIVLRKKPLIFLHWYHHVTVLLFCWEAYVSTASNGLFFTAMNYSVHSVMYFYYFLQAIRKMPKWFPSWIITVMQIAQMIAGSAIIAASSYLYVYGGEGYAPGTCNNTQRTLISGGIIYASYLYLFVEFALKRFVFGSSSGTSKKSRKEGKKLE